MSKLNFWKDKKVFITGHTGFKGSWLSLWLMSLGAKVKGFSLSPITSPSLFYQIRLSSELDHNLGDIRDQKSLKDSLMSFHPDIVFHLAAQPLVRQSYTDPLDTWNTNVIGTINLLESLRLLKKNCAAIFVTSDKCYENYEWVYGYRETDRLGGHDPYSSSKAGAELAIQSWQKSFFDTIQHIGIASVRAGNVIGGGDWTEGRIVPDIIDALSKNKPIQVRNPSSTRPWQHVLEPLGGYLLLAQKIYECLDNPETKKILCSPFNFGPSLDSNCSVQMLVKSCLKYWEGSWLDCSQAHQPHEAKFLNLSIDKSVSILQWRPIWRFDKTVEETITWYKNAYNLGVDSNLREFSLKQIQKYESSWLELI